LSSAAFQVTDIIHVLEGSATFVTGGTAVEPKTIAPDEIRGKEIRGGELRRIGKGDVIIVPNGVPHWFKQVDPPLLYCVVKVTSAKSCKGFHRMSTNEHHERPL